MSQSEVFHSDLRATLRRTTLDKLETLLTRAQLEKRIQKGDLVAIKVHFGELGNTAYIRPVYVRRVVEMVKALGGKPFITDTNTLYVGTRSDAVNHLGTAIANGWDYSCVGAPLIIADGLRGNSFIKQKVDGVNFKEVEIASEIVNADAIVCLTHFKCHELSGFGGSLKNMGMGCASRAGKLHQHSGVSPKVVSKKCVSCRQCLKWCAHSAITMAEKAVINKVNCVGCGECILTCPHGAIQIQWTEGPKSMQEKMAEFAVGAMKSKKDKCVFVNFITQVSPACDCYGYSDAPIVPDIGMVAGTDPVAVDQASADLVNQRQGNFESALKANHAPGEDKFRGVYPDIDWQVQLDCAAKLGGFSRSYTLTKVE